MPEKIMYKSGYLPIKINGCTKDQLVNINNQFLARLKKLLKNYRSDDYETKLISDVLEGKEFNHDWIYYRLTCWFTNLGEGTQSIVERVELGAVVIFPFSWIKRGHKVRNDVDPEIKRSKKHFFRIYKTNLHKRSKFHALRKRK